MARQKRLERAHRGLHRWMGRRVGRFAEDADGSVFVEFAFMMPILIVILMMVITLSHMMMVDRKVTITAQAAADLISQRAAVDNSNINDVRLAAGLMMQPFSPDFDISVAHIAFAVPGGAPSMGEAGSWRAVINGAAELPDGLVEGMADGTNISAPPPEPGDPPVTGPLGTPGDALIMLRMNYRYQSLWVGDFSFFGINVPANLTFTKFTYARPRLNRQITASAPLLTASP